MSESVALLGWDEDPIRVVQDVHWLLDDRADSTNQLRVTTSLAEADGVDAEQELIFKSRRFTISGVERDRAADEAVITADEAQAALADVVIVGFRPNSWTLTRAMNAVLDDTLWTLGEVNGTRYGRADFDEITALDALHFLARHQDAKLSFDSLRRRVNITQNHGTAHEYVFTYGRQLSNIEKDVQQPTTTVIYPTMADDVVLDPVEDYGYYLSQGLTRNEAHERFRKEEHWDDSRYEVEENMTRDAVKRLEEEAYPSITYTLTAQATVDVEGADDFDLSELRLGDTVYVWDQEIDTKLSAEVTAVTTSSDQSQNELTLSTLPASLGDSVESRGYFGDSGKPSSGGPRRSGPQPRPSMPILEQMGDYGIAVTRWNGQDHEGNYNTIPQRFGTLLTLVAPLEGGVIPSPMDSSHTFQGSDIIARGGGTSTIGFNGYGEFAIWHQMRGWDGQTMSPLSEPLVVDVPPAWDPAPTVAKLDDLNDVRLPSLEADLAQAQADADQQFATLDQRADDHDTAISDATDRLTTAETTLEPLPGDVADAKSSATAAREAAEAAEARAVEASQNAGNRIDNGGFELGLDHWTTTNVTLTSDAHSGDQAALIADGGLLSPVSSIPVSAGDVWDISIFGKGSTGTLDIAIQDVDDAGNVVSVVDTFTLSANGAWVNSGAQRVEMGDDGRISIEISAVGADWSVDDIVLRDVTDVVRLEQAAQAAADKADAAQAKADAVELAQTGITDRLDTAENALTDKAESSALSELDSRLSEAFQQGFADLRALTGAKGTIWTEDTAPDAGTTYEWAGTAHASESIKRVDGVEVARNLVANPSFETGLHDWVSDAGGATLTRTTGYASPRQGIYISSSQASGGSQWATLVTEAGAYIAASPGQWIASSAWLSPNLSGGLPTRLLMNWVDADGAFIGFTSSEWTTLSYPDGGWLTVVGQAPEGAVEVRLGGQMTSHDGGNLGDNYRLFTDMWTAATAVTEADALAHVEEYFDGDAQDDRANDLWIDADGIPHKWHVHEGWTAIEDQRIIDAAQAADDAQATADGAVQDAQAAQTAADTAQSTASDAEQAALDAAGIAEGKGQVIYQVTAPTGTRARTENLWIRSTDDKVHVYIGNSWAPATDPDLIAAAQAAANAQDAADTAQSRADAAHTEAGVAWGHADAAMTRAGEVETEAKSYADSLPKVMHGITSPAGTAPNNSIWWQHAGSISGAVVAQWVMTEGSWQSTPIDSEAIANLDVGKLTAGTAEVVETVTERLLANRAVVRRLEAEQGYVGGVNLENGAVTAEKVTVTDQLITNIFGANRALIEDELVVQGNLIANNADLINAAMQNLSVTERANFVNAFAEQLYADEFTARVSTVGRQIVAARNLVPNATGWGDITSGGPAGFSNFGFSVPRSAVWVQGENGVNSDVPFELASGVDYSFTVDMEASIPGTVFYAGVSSQETGQNIYPVSNEENVSGDWQAFSSTFQVPQSGKYTLRIFANHPNGANNDDSYQWFRNIRVESALDGRLIVQGLLQATTGELEELFFDTAVGNTIAAGTGEFLELNADQIRSNSWTGIVATGPTFQTHEAANEGVKMTPAGIRAWDSSGDLMARINGTDNYFRGSIHAGVSTTSEVHVDYGEKTIISNTQEGSSSYSYFTPFIDFRAPGSYRSFPSLSVDDRDGGLRINPGYTSITPDYRGQVEISGDVTANHTVARSRLESNFELVVNAVDSRQSAGFRQSNSRMRIKGRLDSGAFVDDMISHGTSGPQTIAPGNFYRASYSQSPTPTGTRTTIASTQVSTGSYGYGDWRTAIVSTSHRSSSGFNYIINTHPQNSGDVQVWVYFIALWV